MATHREQLLMAMGIERWYLRRNDAISDALSDGQERSVVRAKADTSEGKSGAAPALSTAAALLDPNRPAPADVAVPEMAEAESHAAQGDAPLVERMDFQFAMVPGYLLLLPATASR